MPFINVRWADNTKDLKRNLKEGVDQIEVTKTSVDKLVKSLSGENVINAAQRMAAAISKIGDAGKLTEGNQARVNATMTKAVEILEAAGKGGSKLAQHFRDLASQTEASAEKMSLASRASAQLGDSFKTLTAAFTVGNIIADVTNKIVNGLIEWGKESIRAAGALVDLSAKTGLTTETLQRMEFAGSQSGVSLEALSDAAYKLGVRLGQGGGGVRKAVEDLGLSYQQLKAQSPDEQFNTVIKKLEQMTDTQERNRIGTELFGKSFSGIAAAVTKGYSDLASAAKVSSDAQIQAIDRSADAWDAFIKRQKTGLASWLGNMVIANETIKKLTAEQAEIYKRFLVTGQFDQAQKFLLDVAGKLSKQVDIVLPKESTRSVVAFSAELAKARAEVAKLTVEERKEIAAAQAIGKSTEEITDRFGISAAALRVLNTSTKDYTTAQKNAAKSAKESQAELDKLNAALDKFTHATILDSIASLKTWGDEGRKQLRAQIDDFIKSRDEAEKLIQTIYKLENATKVGHIDVSALPGRVDIETVGRLKEQFKGVDKATSDWADRMNYAALALSKLGQISGGSFGAILQGSASVLGSMQQVVAVMGDANASAAQLANAYQGLAVSVASFIIQIAEMEQAAGNAARHMRWLRDISSDFKSSTLFSDQLNQSLQTTFERLAKLAGDGTTAYDKLIAKVRELQGASAADKFVTNLTEALNLSAIIKDLGGFARLSGDQLDYVAARMENLLQLIALGGSVGADAINELDESLAEMGRTSAKNGGLVSQTFLTIVRDARAAGVELDKVNGFMLEQAKSIGTGLAAFAKGSGVITSQSAASALGSSVLAAFTEMQRQGVAVSEIIAQLGPVIDDLGKKFDAAGFSGGAAFDAVREMAALAKDEFAGPVIEGINGLGQALTGLHNIGALDADTFLGLTRQIKDGYNALAAQGKGGVAALRLLQQPLQTIWALHKDTGYAIDAETQALLDEAEAQGIVGDKQRPIQEQMLLATQKIADAVTFLAEAFGYVGAAAEDAAGDINAAFGKIKIPKIKIPITWNLEDLPEGTIPHIPSTPPPPTPFPSGVLPQPSGGGVYGTLASRTSVGVTGMPTTTATSFTIENVNVYPPEGTSLADMEAFAPAFLEGLRRDTGFIRTAVEQVVEKKVEDLS